MPKKRSSIFVPIVVAADALEVQPEPRSFARLYITERQLEILSWVQQGMSARDIGGILGISPKDRGAPVGEGLRQSRCEDAFPGGLEGARSWDSRLTVA